MTLLQETNVRGFRKIAFVVQQMQNPYRFLGDEVDDRYVICVANCLPLDFLLRVFKLLELKDVFIEVELKVFVRIVDAKLLETVFLKIIIKV